ncbi:formylglycine-generating enzyme family protein [Alteraurantiacibacter aquimixticola]|uniref:Formylglycine-generating enzyme family protein n=1 Tax=Alteraurantiacibacter aquimixticola TaxID=2489173 RepID=A0A4T3F4B1_9SPHN|nr:formylglycine-generating enzyme family protein [Alteraurantiacibacter aquimixticola]TIX52126.1 formylglycine-generating enzyme family protein [Alteraurantiacibacter aquimixticola]
MRRLEGGRFLMGSDRFYPEEAPVREVEVGPFTVDMAPVTNDRFARFVWETDYVTLAEKAPDLAHYPDADPSLLVAGSSVFTPPAVQPPLNDSFEWWSWTPGACWRHPEGPGSSIADRSDHPVVHVALEDAQAFAAWEGKRLPTEAEWEFAARGGLEGADYAWGDELAPDGRMMANYWQGRFPTENSLEDGFARTSPVGHFPANGYGLSDMIGNVWEWTTTPYAPAQKEEGASCCAPDARMEVDREREGYAFHLIKGGSHLCAENYCRRYRPAARYPQSVDTSTSHIGFRCVVDV